MSREYGKADRPVFIGGLMKSGTSLLRTLIGQHPDVFASFETHWFSDDLRVHWNDPDTKRMTYLVRFFELSDADYRALCAEKRADPHREFIDIVLEFCSERGGKSRWAEKTPDNIRHWSLIQRIWPSARLIHVTREYKDCFASWKVRRGDNLEDFLGSTAHAYDDIEGLLGTSTDSYLEVDYVDLVRDTENTMRRVLDFAELAWNPRCAALDLNRTGEEREKVQEVTGRDSLTSVSLTRPIFSDSLGQWRTMLTTDEAARIEAELAGRYRVLGTRWPA